MILPTIKYMIEINKCNILLKKRKHYFNKFFKKKKNKKFKNKKFWDKFNKLRWLKKLRRKIKFKLKKKKRWKRKRNILYYNSNNSVYKLTLLLLIKGNFLLKHRFNLFKSFSTLYIIRNFIKFYNLKKAKRLWKQRNLLELLDFSYIKKKRAYLTRWWFSSDINTQLSIQFQLKKIVFFLLKKKKYIWKIFKRKKGRFLKYRFYIAVLKKKKFKKKIKFNPIKYYNYYSYIKKKSFTSTTVLLSLKKRIFLNNNSINNILTRYFYKNIKHKLLVRNFRYKKKNYSWNKVNMENSSLATHIFKKNKINKYKIIYLNYHKYLLWKIRKSRYTHWSLKSNGNINKWRYQKLFYKEIKKQSFFKQFYKLFIISLLHYNKLSLSWRQTFLLEKYRLFLVNGNYYYSKNNFTRGDIIEFCYGKGLILHKKKYKYYNNRIIRRLKRWSYKTYINTKKFKKIRKIPKSIKSIGLGFKTFGKLIMTNRGLGLTTILYPLNNYTTVQLDSIYKTTIFKLNNWRYRFN